MRNETYFSPALFKFLRELKKNNNREWFQANKARYESDVRDPMLRFIADFADPLHTISRHFIADPRPVDGSLFRIYRDTRFSKDKTPYKTTAAAHFRHEAGGDVHAPGFYFHFEPGEVVVGAGIWHPDPETLTKIRDAIVEHPEQWKRAVSGKAFEATCELWGEKLKRLPNGYDPAHPFIEDLKRKDFVARASLTEADACKPDFMDRVADVYRAAAPFAGLFDESSGAQVLKGNRRQGVTGSYRVKNDRAKALLGWKPRYPTFREGSKDVIVEYRKSAIKAAA
jgi:uncharacterized protein (TIGR02453 family)